MAKDNKSEDRAEEMSVAEARKIRAAAHKESVKAPSEQENKEAFRIFWATEKAKYGKSKDLEQVIWLHLKATGMTSPDKFDAGIKHFGLTKIR